MKYVLRCGKNTSFCKKLILISCLPDMGNQADKKEKNTLYFYDADQLMGLIPFK